MRDITAVTKDKKRILIIFGILLIGVLLSHLTMLIIPQVSAAEQSLRVSPVIINITLSPGKTYKHEVTVENLTNAPLPLRATLNDFITSDEEGGYIFEETRTNPLLSWIDLSETEFIIGPKEKKSIQMTIRTPKSIQLGGYYGILFFEPVSMRNGQANGAQVNSKVGVLMLANVGVTDPNAPKAEVVDFSTPFLDDDGILPLVLRVKNISLNFFTAKPTITMIPLINLNNTAATVKPFEDKIIFPGKIRRWTEDTMPSSLSPNLYQIHAAVSTGNGHYVTVDRYVIIFPYKQAFFFTLALLSILFILKKRKRFKKALMSFYK